MYLHHLKQACFVVGRSIQVYSGLFSSVKWYLQSTKQHENIIAINTRTTNITNKVGPFNPHNPINPPHFTSDLRPQLDMDFSPYHIGGNGSLFTPGQSGRKMDEMTKLFGRIQLHHQNL